MAHHCYCLEIVSCLVLFNDPRSIQLTCVWTPSTTSTRTKAPSQSREADETSEAKSTCPGVSMTLQRCLDVEADRQLRNRAETSRLVRNTQHRVRRVSHARHYSPTPSPPTRFMSNLNETAEDSIVIPLSCSSSLESRNRNFPARRDEMILLDERRLSAKDVLP